jgi:hypothetical protein
MTIRQMCDEIAEELARKGITIRNLVTGKEVHTSEDVFNFSSRGELFHIWEWYSALFPDRISFESNGDIRFASDPPMTDEERKEKRKAYWEKRCENTSAQ